MNETYRLERKVEDRPPYVGDSRSEIIDKRISERLSYLALAHAIVGDDERSERIRIALRKSYEKL